MVWSLHMSLLGAISGALFLLAAAASSKICADCGLSEESLSPNVVMNSLSASETSLNPLTKSDLYWFTSSALPHISSTPVVAKTCQVVVTV